MIKQIKMAFKLQKFGFQTKTQFVSMLIMLALGLGMEITSHGTYWIGSFFILMAPMFPTQSLYSICMSSLITASPYGKQIQTKIAALCDMCLSLIFTTVLVFLKFFEMNRYPADQGTIVNTLVILSFMMLVVHIYTAFVYRFYAASIIIMFVAIVPLAFILGYDEGTAALLIPFAHLPYGLAVLIVYASVFLGLGLQYLITNLIYRIPLSKYAQGAAMRKYLKN